MNSRTKFTVEGILRLGAVYVIPWSTGHSGDESIANDLGGLRGESRRGIIIHWKLEIQGVYPLSNKETSKQRFTLTNKQTCTEQKCSACMGGTPTNDKQYERGSVMLTSSSPILWR